MRVGIHGIGVAGPTLAFWLARYGHEPVLFEKAPALRTGGYVIDFWGPGYDVAERMGIVEGLHARGYAMKELRLVDGSGSTSASLMLDGMNEIMKGRFVSIPRGDIAATIFEACEGVDARFGTSIDGLASSADGVVATLSDGTQEQFDLVIGADGLHSTIRRLAFDASNHERDLGCCVAAFRVRGYRPRDELTYVAHTVPNRQVARISLRGDETVFLFICRSELIADIPHTQLEIREVLRNVFGDMGWEVPAILEHMDAADDIYFDRVMQIQLDAWTRGRVALIGDAAACASLLAGEGTGLAMTEAYVLAGELCRAGSDYKTAFRNYEARLRPWLAKKQDAALTNIGFFVPRSTLSRWVRDRLVSLASFPFVAKRVAASMLDDSFPLPVWDTAPANQRSRPAVHVASV